MGDLSQDVQEVGPSPHAWGAGFVSCLEQNQARTIPTCVGPMCPNLTALPCSAQPGTAVFPSFDDAALRSLRWYAAHPRSEPEPVNRRGRKTAGQPGRTKNGASGRTTDSAGTRHKDESSSSPSLLHSAPPSAVEASTKEEEEEKKKEEEAAERLVTSALRYQVVRCPRATRWPSQRTSRPHLPMASRARPTSRARPAATTAATTARHRLPQSSPISVPRCSRSSGNDQ